MTRPTATERECGCPPWVEPCVHFDGRVVYIGRPNGALYEVHGPTKILIESNDPMVRRHDGCVPSAFWEERLARDEFDRRAEQLLGA